MPCSSGNEYGGITYVDSETKPQLDKVTRLLCGLCREVENISVAKYLIEDNIELRKWWEDHQEVDRRRLKAEQKEREEKQKRKAALSKLTLEEKRILGL